MAVGIIDPRRRPCWRKVEPFKKQMKVNGEINKSIQCAKKHEHFGQALPNYPGNDFPPQRKTDPSKLKDSCLMFDGQHDLVEAQQIGGK